MPPSKKQKLTLSVNREAVAKARKIGLNLSDITEKVLQGFTSAPSEADNSEIYTHYKSLFAVMLPVLKQYDLSIQIGSIDYYDQDQNPLGVESFTFGSTGKISQTSTDSDSVNEVAVEAIPTADLFEPNRILSSFIDKLSDAKQRNKERIEQLQLAKRIIEVMADSFKPKTGKTGDREPSGIEHSSH